MNHIYKVVFNKSTGTFVATTEFAAAHGKSSGTRGSLAKAVDRVPAVVRKFLPLNAMALGLLLASGQAVAVNAVGDNTCKVYNISASDISLVCGDATTTLSSTNGIVIGSGAKGAALDVTVVGWKANSTSAHGLALGSNAWATGKEQAIAIGGSGGNGPGTYAQGDQSIAIGGNTHSQGNSSIAIGGDDLDSVASTTPPAYNDNTGNTAQLNNTDAAKTYTKLTGDYLVNFSGTRADRYASTKSGEGAVALGVQSQAGNLATAFGTRAKAIGVASVALGVGSTADKDGAIAVGAGSNTTTSATKETEATVNGIKYSGFVTRSTMTPGDQVSVGSKGYERQIKNVAAGSVAADSTDAINGSQLYMVADKLVSATNTYFHTNNVTNSGTGDATTNLGNPSDAAGATASFAIAAGVEAKSSARSAIAMGHQANATAGAAMALGSNATAQAGTSIAMGAGAVTLSAANAGIAVGERATSSGQRDIFIGRDAGVGATANVTANLSLFNNIGIGERAGANITGSNVVAIGTDAGFGSKGKNNIAIGSQANSEAFTKTPVTADYTVAIGDRVRAYGNNAVGVGYFANASAARTVALGSTAAASADDALAVGSDANASGVAAIAVGSRSQAQGSSALAGGNGANASGGFSIALGGLANAAKDNAIAVGQRANAADVSAIAVGNRASATASSSVAMGVSSAAGKISATALGASANASEAYSVALGSESTTSAKVNTNEATVGGITYGDFAGNVAHSTVSVGNDKQKRTITNVAAGRISATSTDAINGSQLYATNVVIGNLANTTAANLGGDVKVGADGKLTQPSYNVVSGKDTPNTVGSGTTQFGATAKTVADGLTNLNTYVNLY